MAPASKGKAKGDRRSTRQSGAKANAGLRRAEREMERARRTHARLAKRLRPLQFGRRLSSTEEVQVVQAGVPVELLREIQKEAGLTQEGLSKALGIPRRTLINHMKKDHLDVDGSDRVIRLKRILEKATETFDADKESALSWLKSPNRALGGNTPIELVSTSTGGRAVEEVLGRMEHSLYS